MANKIDPKKREELLLKHKAEREAFDKDFETYSKIERNFQEKLRILMEERNITMLQLAEEIRVSPKTLSRYVNIHSSPSKEVLAAICIALKLDVRQSTALASSLSASFSGTDRTDYAYLYLIENYRNNPEATVDYCNEVLAGLGIDDRNLLGSRMKKKENE